MLLFLTSCYKNEADTSLNDEMINVDFIISGDYYDEENNFVLKNTDIYLDIITNNNIEALVINDVYYKYINDDLSFRVDSLDYFNINITSIIIDDKEYNIAFSKTINVIDKFSIQTISPIYSTSYHEIELDVNKINALNIPIYMDIDINNTTLYAKKIKKIIILQF